MDSNGNTKMRFDFILMNPPYERNLHLKFLEKVIKVADKTVNISPVRWLQDPLAKYKKNSDLKKYRDSIINHIEKIDFLHSKKATEIFGGENVAVFKSDLGIYLCSSKGGYNPDSFSNPIMDKVVNSKYCGIPIMKKSQCLSGNFCILNDILGNHSGTAGFGNYMPLIKSVDTYGKYYYQGKSEKNGKTVEENKAMNSHSVNGKTDNWTVVSLNTENELLNFYNSTETTFFKYIFCVSLVDVHVHPQFLPWMGDYTEPWTNARFCEYFGITGFISDTEAEPGSEWETILETMKKYA